MARILFSLLLAIHGLIHLPGFSKATPLAKIGEQTTKTINGQTSHGLLWLFVTVLFIVSALVFAMKKDWWWITAAEAVILSQFLVIIYWPDAKFGTIPNIIIALVVIAGFGSWKFNHMVNNEIRSMLPAKTNQGTIATEAMTKDLPPIVQTWLKRSNVIGKKIAQTVELKQSGTMRTTPGGKWMPVTAVQYFTIEKPAFVWVADVKAGPLMHLAGRDKYENGKGNMLIKLFSLLTVTDASGEKTDQGTMLRYLAEICWFPSAALSKYITWEANDPLSAKATMKYGNITASGIFTFTREGDLQSFEAMRYYDRKDGATLERWHIETDKDAYGTFGGVRIPTRSTVTWKLNTGDFPWYRLSIDDVKYDVAAAGKR